MNLIPIIEDPLEKYLFKDKIINDAKMTIVEREDKPINIDPIPLSVEEFVYGEALLVE